MYLPLYAMTFFINKQYRSIYKWALDVLRGAAQGITGRALKRVAGNIRSGLFPDARGGSDFSDLASLNTFSGKFKTKNLTFPMDVEAG